MHSLIFQQSNKCIAHRYITLVIFVCSAFSVFAQHDISQRIYDALISINTRDCKALMQQIKETDIVNLPDSTLFDYYYLAGWYSYENNNHEEQIEYLEKAKDICETRLGIDNYILAYFDIIKALGEACEDLGKDEEALLWKVDDEATKILMTEFYKNYLSGKTKRESLQMAQQTLRQTHPEPEYWAGFILLDGLNQNREYDTN